MHRPIASIWHIVGIKVTLSYSGMCLGRLRKKRERQKNSKNKRKLHKRDKVDRKNNKTKLKVKR